MVWFRVDDGLPTSRKVLQIPRRRRAAAVGVWTLAGAWSAHQLTDGFIPTYALDEIPDGKKYVTDLVSVGLWLEVDNGWTFHDWADYQPAKTVVVAERAAHSARQKAYRDRKKAERDAHRDASRVTDENVTRDMAVTAPRPDPTRPDPTVVPTELLQPKTDEGYVSNANADHDVQHEPRSKPIHPNINRIARHYTDVVKLSDKSKICAVVLNAVGAGYDEQQITDALDRLADVEMPVTADTLRIEITGKRGRASPIPRIATSDQRVADGLDLARRLAQRESRDEQQQRMEIEA